MTNPTGLDVTAAALPDGLVPASRAGRGVLLAVLLVSVAVLSGFVWWLIRHDSEPGGPVAAAGSGPSSSLHQEPTPPPATRTTQPGSVEAGRFSFAPAAPADSTADCASVAYGDVRDWLADHACERVGRGLYTVASDEAEALVSVVVVTMPDEAGAAGLKALTDTSGTGNVSDMLRDGTAQVPDGPDVAGGAYASNADGNRVTIVEAALFGDQRRPALLDEITVTARQLADHVG